MRGRAWALGGDGLPKAAAEMAARLKGEAVVFKQMPHAIKST